MTLWVIHLIRTTLCDIDKCNSFINDIVFKTKDEGQNFEHIVWFLLTIALTVSGLLGTIWVRSAHCAMRVVTFLNLCGVLFNGKLQAICLFKCHS